MAIMYRIPSDEPPLSVSQRPLITRIVGVSITSFSGFCLSDLYLTLGANSAGDSCGTTATSMLGFNSVSVIISPSLGVMVTVDADGTGG